MYELLQAIFGDLDEMSPSTHSAPSSPADASEAAWESWKAKLGSSAAKIIDSLKQHGNLNTTQLSMFAKMDPRTVNKAIYVLNKAGLIEKSGGRFSLKHI